MNILVPKSLTQFDITKPLGMKNPGGGMGTKYSRVRDLLSQRYPNIRLVSDIDEIDSDSVIVDAFWFASNPKEKVDAFLDKEFRFSLLYGSQENLLTWPNTPRKKLLGSITHITHNCRYQQNLYRVCGIYHSRFLCDPVPEHIFYPAPKNPRIFCSGQISWEKNTIELIKLYRILQEETDIKTCYAGTATLWGENVCSTAKSMRNRLETDLQEVTDDFLW